MHQVVLCAILLCFFLPPGAPFAGHDSQAYQVIYVDLGSNLTIPCGSVSSEGGGQSVMWIRDGRGSSVTNHVQKDGSIHFQKLQVADSGLYSCSLDNSEDDNSNSKLAGRVGSGGANFRQMSGKSWIPIESRFQIQIRVRTPPQLLKNVTVQPFTILALVMWEVDEKDGSGGYPIQSFHISYRLKNSTETNENGGDAAGAAADWQSCPSIYIRPDLRQYEIYHLHPNSTYLVQVWATNKLGKGPSTTVECSTHSNPQEIELGKHFLDGVDTFDVRIWIIAVAVVISTLCILGIATCCLFYKEYVVNIAHAHHHHHSRDNDGEHIELMPNIILNPGYDFQSLQQEPDENSNDTSQPHRLNNNSVIYPARV